MAYNLSPAKSSNGLLVFMDGKPIEYIDTFSISAGSAPTFDVSTFNSTAEELGTGLRSADTVSITGRFTPSPRMVELDQLSKSDETRQFSFITFGDVVNGKFTGKGLKRMSNMLTVKTPGVLASGVTTVVFTELGANVAPIADGDYLVGESPKVCAQIVKRSVNQAGELTLDVEGDAVTGTAASKKLTVVAPAYRTNATASVTSFSSQPTRNDAHNFALELQVTGSVVNVVGNPDVDVADLTFPS